MPSHPSVVRPAVAAAVLLALVALTAYVLFLWWPAGVAIGVAVGGASVLAVGAQMQRTNARVPIDELLVERLGVPAAARARAVAPPRSVPAPAAAPVVQRVPVTVPAVAPLPAQADDAWFTTGRAAPAAAEPETVVEPAAEAVEVAPAAAAAAVEPEPAAEPQAVEPAAVEPEPIAEPEAIVEPEPVAEPEAIAEPEPEPAARIEDDEPDTIPATDFVITDDVAVRTDLEQLKDDLGEDYLDFARAARLVVETQYASAARLQRDLDVPYSRARRLLSDLEEQHFVGPATGSLPRVVLMPKDALPDLERLLEEV